MQGLNLDEKSTLRLLTGFLAEETRKAGLKRAVLGLSGGIDSALVAALAARALGPQNVWGICMPYRLSSPESARHAAEAARAFGIRFLSISISPQVDSYFRRFPQASALRRGNKMARERMSILYDQSAGLKALVLGTSNKTELLLGYGTLFGDMASALNPIGDLYKTQVRQLSRFLKVPRPILDKPPSADLWRGQTDEAELGFTYEAVDRFLYLKVDQRADDHDLREAGFSARFARAIQARLAASQYKRRPPLIAKVSGRTIDREFRYPRDWGR